LPGGGHQVGRAQEDAADARSGGQQTAQQNRWRGSQQIDGHYFAGIGSHLQRQAAEDASIAIPAPFPSHRRVSERDGAGSEQHRQGHLLIADHLNSRVREPGERHQQPRASRRGRELAEHILDACFEQPTAWAPKDVRARIAPQLLQAAAGRAARDSSGIHGADGGANHDVGLKAAFFEGLPDASLIGSEGAAGGEDYGVHNTKKASQKAKVKGQK